MNTQSGAHSDEITLPMVELDEDGILIKHEPTSRRNSPDPMAVMSLATNSTAPPNVPATAQDSEEMDDAQTDLLSLAEEEMDDTEVTLKVEHQEHNSMSSMFDSSADEPPTFPPWYTGLDQSASKPFAGYDTEEFLTMSFGSAPPARRSSSTSSYFDAMIDTVRRHRHSLSQKRSLGRDFVKIRQDQARRLRSQSQLQSHIPTLTLSHALRRQSVSYQNQMRQGYEYGLAGTKEGLPRAIFLSAQPPSYMAQEETDASNRRSLEAESALLSMQTSMDGASFLESGKDTEREVSESGPSGVERSEAVVVVKKEESDSE
jgi:hypothetical protein